MSSMSLPRGGAGTILAGCLAAAPAAAQERSIENEGWRQYMVHCARCHGDDAIGGLCEGTSEHQVTAGHRLPRERDVLAAKRGTPFHVVVNDVVQEQVMHRPRMVPRGGLSGLS